MKKTLWVSLLCSALVLAFALPAVYAVDAPADGTKLVYFPKKEVVFNHSTHKSVDCKICHHTWDGAAKIGKCNDAGCHDNMDSKAKDIKALYMAFHTKEIKAKDSCYSCHVKIAGDDAAKKKELAGCAKSKCHP